MLRNALILLALVAVVGLPFAFKPKNSLLADADETLVIVTPHNEAIRYEFARGFRDWYKARTGKVVRIDWRTPGGTTEIAHYLAGEYQAPFEHYWRKTERMRWTVTAARSFDDPKVKLTTDASKDTEQQMARRAFLTSDVGIGIDLFFGGGSFDFAQQAAAGRLVDTGFVKAHPEIFNDTPEGIPLTLGGEPFRDRDGAWIGTVLSAFGICYNVDGMRRVDERGAQLAGAGRTRDPFQDAGGPPSRWEDLADPACYAQVALADPNQSGSVAKAFEMIIQQQIQTRLVEPLRIWHTEHGTDPLVPPAQAILGVDGSRNTTDFKGRIEPAAETVDDAKTRGWEEAMRTIQRMGANARYFTDAATKIPIDVSDGDAAIGMAIDFYGRFEAESSRDPLTGKERMHYVSPVGGTSIGVDPVGMLRGAPHPELAKAFIEYVLSVDGQKLWDFKVGTPGGPEKYALRRSPIRRELYAPEFKPYRSDPDVYPYEEAKSFTYHPEWTAALFNPIRFVVRVMCIDPHDEARAAWADLITTHFPPKAMGAFEDVSAVSYAEAKGRIAETLRNPDKMAETKLAAELTERFRAQYRHAGNWRGRGSEPRQRHPNHRQGPVGGAFLPMVWSLPPARPLREDAAAMNRVLAALVYALTAAFFAVFFVYPIVQTLRVAFFVGHDFTFNYVVEVFRNPVYVEGLRNAFLLAVGSTLAAFTLAMPLAWLGDRYEFAGKKTLSALLLAPMILPPFVGAIGVKKILGQEGSLNALLHDFHLLGSDRTIDWLGQNRFWGVVALNALHLYPVLYLNIAAALANIDPAMEEAAENLGTTGWRKFFKITLPLIAPGVFAGGTIVFIWAFTELGVPLIFDYTRVTSVQIFYGIKDIGNNPFPYALVAVMLVATMLLYVLSRVLFGRKVQDLTMMAKATSRGGPRRVTGRAAWLCAGAFGVVIFLAMLPHLGVVLVAFSRDWYGTILPDELDAG